MEPEEDDQTLTTPVLPLAALVLSLVLAGSRIGSITPVRAEGLLLVGPLLGYALSEMLAPRLAGFGRFPLSAAAFLVAVACPQLGRGPWLMLLAGGLLIRLVRGRMRKEPLLSLVSDGLPELWAGLAAWSAPESARPLASGLIYFLAWQFLPGLFAQAVPSAQLSLWTLARERSATAVIFLCLLGSVLSGLASANAGSVALLLFGLPLLSITLAAQLKVLAAESEGRKQARVERRQQRAGQELNKLQSQVEMQRLEVELQHRVLTLVGELFMETATIQSPADLRPALLSFVRRAIPCQRISLYESEFAGLRLSAGFGPDELQPGREDLDQMAGERVKALQTSRNGIHHLSAHIPQRGLLVVSDPQGRWEQSHHHLLLRLAHHLPMCLDAVRYREIQSRVLADEQTRRQELDQLASRLTATLDLLGQLVSCRSLGELVETAQRRLPELVPGFQVEVRWREQLYRSGALAQTPPRYTFALQAGTMGEGQLLLFGDAPKPLLLVDTELLRLFSIQFACLLEGAELNARLLKALEQVKTSQAQVVQSSKMAAIGQLAAGVAHELNTPLGAVSIAVELSIETVSDNPEKSRKRLEKALESIDQMRGIISKLLFYSRDSRGVRARVDLNKVMDDSFQLVAHTMKMTGIEVEVAAGPPVVIEANSNELQQVFSNLLINAKDACGTPGASLKRIEMWLEEKDQQALVHVKDYGCGMDEETRQRIFDPFYTTKAIGEGTGLGLSTSLELVQQHGGTLSCQSQPGQGTHFIVALPLKP
ncbi:HAMP domain-containing histidine kinase [bacterium]|nr:HAMP domain-containing histidine kinase [bacterium]